MNNYKSEMFKAEIKDYALYIIPQAVLRHIFGSKRPIESVYSSIKSKESGSVGLFVAAQLGVALFFSMICIIPMAAVVFGRIFVRNKIYIHRVEMSITTYCTLKCRACSNLMQYYNTPYHIPYEKLIASIEGMLEPIVGLRNLVILGGEPFLYPELAKLLEYITKQSKIKRIQVLTNGIIRINDEVIKQLRDSRVLVSVSDYGLHENKIDNTCRILKENGIMYGRTKQKKWFDFGDLSDKGRSNDEIQKQFERCEYKCRCILNGKLYICPRASHGVDLGSYEDNANVDLISSADINERKKQILNVYYLKRFIPACKYCDAGTNDCREIECGEQK